MKITQPDRNVLDLNISCSSKQKGSIMCMSDVHFDSIKCDTNLFEKHLAMAEECKAPVLIGGDLFDAMQGHDDPRRSLDELRKEYKHDNYYDLIVLDVAKTLLKYKVTYILGMGNHESSVQSKSNTNLIERLAHDLNTRGGRAYSMGYWGFLRMRFSYEKGNTQRTKVLYWHHGIGGTAPITRGVLDTVRQSSYMPDADVIMNGHNHQEYVLTLNRIKLGINGVPFEEYQHFLRIPGYKRNGLISGDRNGFDIEKVPAPTTRGCVRLDYEFSKNEGVNLSPCAVLS
jgi:hypothetical protein